MVDSVDIADQKLNGLLRDLQSGEGWANFRPNTSITDWRNVTIDTNLTLDETTDLIAAFPELSFTFAKQITVNSHAMAGAIRRASYHAVMNRLEATHEKFVDIGGNPMLFITKSTDVHCCCPILSDHDQHRWNTRRNFANKLIKDNNPLLSNQRVKLRLQQIAKIDPELREPQTFPFVCTNRGQVCSVAADALLSVDSIYDIPISDALECLIKHRATSLHVAYISPHALLQGATEAFIPDVGVTITLVTSMGESGRLISFNTAEDNPPKSLFKRLSDFMHQPSVVSEEIYLNNISHDSIAREKIRYVFMDGNEYVHDASLLLWSMLPRAFKFISKDHRLFNIHVEHEGVRMGYTFLSISRYPATVAVPRNLGAILPAVSDYQIIINWPVVVEGRFVLRAQHLLVPKPVFESLKTHCTKIFEDNTAKEKAEKIAAMKNFLTTLSTRVIVNGKNVSSHKHHNHGYEAQICYAVLDIVVRENKNALMMLHNPKTKKITWLENLLRALTDDQLPEHVLDDTRSTSYMWFFKSPPIMRYNVRMIPPDTPVNLQFNDDRLDTFSKLVGHVVLSHADEAELDERLETLSDFYIGSGKTTQKRECDILIDVVNKQPALSLRELVTKFPDLDMSIFGVRTVHKPSKDCVIVKNIEEFEKAYLAKQIKIPKPDIPEIVSSPSTETNSEFSDTDTSFSSGSSTPSTEPPEVDVSIDGLVRYNGHLVASVHHGDIFNRNCEAIVNPANGHMHHNGGLARLIMDRAGRNIEKETMDIVKNKNNKILPVGDNIITDAGDLRNFKYIIHAVGPDGRVERNPAEQTKLLTRTITNVFLTCDQNGIRSVAIPFISSGIYIVDVNICGNAYLQACLSSSASSALQRVEFVSNNEQHYRVVQKYFTDVSASLQPITEVWSPFNLIEDGVLRTVEVNKRFGDFESYVIREEDARHDSFLASLNHLKHDGDGKIPPLTQIAVRLQDASVTPWTDSEVNAVEEFMMITVYIYNAALRFIKVCANDVPISITRDRCDPNHHQGYWERAEVIRSDPEVTHAYYNGDVYKSHALPEECVAFVCLPYATFYAALRLESIVALDFKTTTRTEAQFVSGVPGCGKTRTLIQLFHSGCIGITATRNTRIQINEAEIADYPSNATKAYTVDGALVYAAKNKTTKNKPKIIGLFDEAPMNHYGGLLLVMSALKLRKALLVGDKKQIGHIDRGGLRPNHSYIPLQPRHHQVVSHRITPHAAAVIAGEYPDGILTTNTVLTLCKVQSLSGIADVTNAAQRFATKNGGILTFTQGHKLQLQKNKDHISSAYHIMTVHEAQGQTFQDVILVRLSPEKLAILDIARNETVTPHMLVGITRHTRNFLYLTADITDGLSKKITNTPLRKELIVAKENADAFSTQLMIDSKEFIGNVGGGAIPIIYVKSEPSQRVRQFLDRKLYDVRVLTYREDNSRMNLRNMCWRLRHTPDRIFFASKEFAVYAAIVSNDDKGRFYIVKRGDKFEIIAAQGHSLKKDDVVLTPVMDATVICHVTHRGVASKIAATGLKNIKREMIHAVEGDKDVAKRCPLARKGDTYIEMNVQLLRNHKIDVFQSVNGVMLIDSDCVPPSLLRITPSPAPLTAVKSPQIPVTSVLPVQPKLPPVQLPHTPTIQPPQPVAKDYYIVSADLKLYKSTTTFNNGVVDRSKIFRVNDRLISVDGRAFDVEEYTRYQQREGRVHVVFQRSRVVRTTHDRCDFGVGVTVYAIDSTVSSTFTDYKLRPSGTTNVVENDDGGISIHIGPNTDYPQRTQEFITSIMNKFIDGSLTDRQSMVIFCTQSIADDIDVPPSINDDDLTIYIAVVRAAKSVQFAPNPPSHKNMCWYNAVRSYMRSVFHAVIDESDAKAFLDAYDLIAGDMQDAIEFLQFCLSDIYGLLTTDIAVDENSSANKPALVHTPNHWEFVTMGNQRPNASYFTTRTQFTVLHRLVTVHDHLRNHWRLLPTQYGKNLAKLSSIIDDTNIETVVELTPAPGNTIKQLAHRKGTSPFRYYSVEHRKSYLTPMNGVSADAICANDLTECCCVEKYTWCNNCKSRICNCSNKDKCMLFLDVARVDSNDAPNQFEFNEEIFQKLVEKASTTNFHVTIKTFCHPRLFDAMFAGLRPWVIFRSHESSPYGSEVYLTTLDVPAASPSQVLRDTITAIIPHLSPKKLPPSIKIDGCIGATNVPEATWITSVKFRGVMYDSVHAAWMSLIFLAPMNFDDKFMHHQLRIGISSAEYLETAILPKYFDEQFAVFFREIRSQLTIPRGVYHDVGIFPRVRAGVVSALINECVPTQPHAKMVAQSTRDVSTATTTPTIRKTNVKPEHLKPGLVKKFGKPNLIDVISECVTEPCSIEPVVYACNFAKWVTIFKETKLPIGDLSLMAFVHGRNFSDHVYYYLTQKLPKEKLAYYQFNYRNIIPDADTFEFIPHDCDGICLADASASKKFFSYIIHPLRPKKACMRFMTTTVSLRKLLGVEVRNVGGALNDVYKPSSYSTCPYPFEGVGYIVEQLPNAYPLPPAKENLIDVILTGNADIITQRDPTRTHFVYPEVITSEPTEDYTRIDVQGCVAIMQCFVDEMTPGNACVDTTYDNVMIELGDIPIEAHNAKFSQSRLMSAPKFTEKPRAKLHSGVQCNFPATPKGVIIGFNKRNANPPRLESAFSPDDRALMLWDALVEFIMVDNAKQMLEFYQRTPIGVTDDGLRFWTARFDTNIKLHRLDAFIESDKYSKTFSVFDVPMDLFTVTIKTKAKTVISTATQVQIAKPQMIMASVPYVTAVLSNVFQAIMVRFESLLPPSVALPWSRNSMNLSASLNYLMKSLKLTPADLTEIDISAFDKSQLEVAHRFKMLAYKKLGLHPAILKAWDECHIHTTNLHEPSGTTFKTWYQQKSGDATTLLGNTLFNLATLAFVFRQRLPAVAAVGDDSLLYTPHHVESKIVEASYIDMCNLEAKVIDKENSAYFCGHFLVQDTVTFDYVLVKDPAKVLYKCGLDSQESLEQLIDRFKSLSDETKHWKIRSLLPGLNTAFKDRYGISHDIYALIDALLNIANDFDKFSALWDYPRHWVPQDKHKLLKRLSRDKHKYVESFYKNHAPTP